MVITNLNKISVYEWFKGIQGWHRIDLLIGLVEMCNPFELRFLASCIEDYAQSDYPALHDQELRANSPNMHDVPNFNKVGGAEFQSHMSISLSLLHSDNYRAAYKYGNILDKMLDNIDVPALISSQSPQAHDFMLILTLASTHPAFCFEKKAKYRDLFLQYEKLIFNTSRRSRITNHNSVEETANCYLPTCHQSPTPRFSQKISTVQAFNSPESVDSAVLTPNVPEAWHNSSASVTYCMPSTVTCGSPSPDTRMKENDECDRITLKSPASVYSDNFINNDESISMELISDQSSLQMSPSSCTYIRKVNVTLDDKSARSPSNRIQFMVFWSDQTKSEVWKTLPEVIHFCERLKQHRQKVLKLNQQTLPETDFQQQQHGNNRIHWKFVRLQQYFRDLPADEISSKYVQDFFKHDKHSEDISPDTKQEKRSNPKISRNSGESLENSAEVSEKVPQMSTNSCEACQLQSMQQHEGQSSSDSSQGRTPRKTSKKQSQSQYEFDTEEDIPHETECLTPHSLHTLSKGSEFTFTFNGSFDDEFNHTAHDNIPFNYHASNVHEDTTGFPPLNQQPFQITQHSMYTQHQQPTNSIRLPSASFEKVEPKLQTVDSGGKHQVFIYHTVPDNTTNGPLRYVQPQNNNFINCPPPRFYPPPPPIQRMPSRTLPTTVCFPPPTYNDDGRQKHIFPLHHHHHMPPIIVPQSSNGQQMFTNTTFAYGKAQDVDSDRDNNSSCSDEMSKDDVGQLQHGRNCVSVDLPSTYFPEPAMFREAWPSNCEHHPLPAASCENVMYKPTGQYGQNNMMPYQNIFQNFYTGDGPMLSSNESYASSKPSFNKPGKYFNKSCFNCGSSGHTNSECPEAGDLKQAFHLKLNQRVGGVLTRNSNTP